MRRYAYKNAYSWNEDLAYIAGLIASDGCMANDGRHINLTSKDIPLLETVRLILNLHGNIHQKLNGFGGIGYYIQFSNVALYDFLLEAGIMPAKSKIIGLVTVPDQFYPDFLRGYFDGDGTVYGYWDPRWPRSLMYYTGFVSASPIFLRWLQTTNKRLFTTSSGAIKPQERAEALTYAKADSQILFSAMYHRTDLPNLQRKKDKFVDFLQLDPYAIKANWARVL